MNTNMAEPQPEATTFFSPAVKELVALGAALACNCEPCLRYHYREAKKLGIGDDDIRSAFDMAAMVKQTPARNAQALAEKLLGSTSTNQTKQEE
jgi:AhpD family alkylhydroperoxidase